MAETFLLALSSISHYVQVCVVGCNWSKEYSDTVRIKKTHANGRCKKESYFPQCWWSACRHVLEMSWKAYSRTLRLNMKLILVSSNLNEDPFFSKERSWRAGRLATFSPGFFPSLFAADLRSHMLLRNCFFFVQSLSFCHFSPPYPRPTLTPNKKVPSAAIAIQSFGDALKIS